MEQGAMVDGTRHERDMSGLRPGAMVRVINQRSPHFGATGHVVGRRDSDDAWLVRFTTLGVTIMMQDDEVEVVRQRAESSNEG